jgi:hypothetical protein
MKRILTIGLLVAALVSVFSCAAAPKAPPGPGEVRLTGIDIPQNGNLSAHMEYWVSVNFEANGNPELRRVCFTFSGEGLTCTAVQANEVIYGRRAHVRVPMHAPSGPKWLECYMEYVQEGEVRRTNQITASVMGYEVR